jgi:DNA-binding CsgD family transcriptional regulator
MIHTLINALSSSVLVLLSDFVLMLVFVGTVSVGAMLFLRYRDAALRDYLLLLLFRGLMHARDTVDSYLYHLIPRSYADLRFLWDVPSVVLRVLTIALVVLLVPRLLGLRIRPRLKVALFSSLGVLLAFSLSSYFKFGWDHPRQTISMALGAATVLGASVAVLVNLSLIRHPSLRRTVRLLLIVNLFFFSGILALNLALVWVSSSTLSVLESRVSDLHFLVFYLLNIALAARYYFTPTEARDIPDLAAAGVQMNLSPRELEIARMVMEGHTNKQIGEALFIAPPTVKTHVYNIYKKLGVSNRVMLANRIRSAASDGS